MSFLFTSRRRGAAASLLAPALLLGALALAAPAARAQTASPGWGLDPAPSFGGSLRELAGGDFLRWNGASLQRLAPDGAVLVTYATFAPSVFTGAFAVAPDESFAIVGESSTGGVYRLDLPAGPLTFLATVDFNYDAAISATGDVVLSAAASSFVNNDLIGIDPASGTPVLLGQMAGASGPVAFGPDGRLWYGTASSSFPAPLGSASIHFWFDFQLTPGNVTLATGVLWQAGLDGASSLAVDPVTGEVYVAESNFTAGYVSKIRRIVPASPASPVLFEGPPGASVGFSQYLPGSGPGVFAPYQPALGGRLRVSWNDFAGTSGVRYLRPARPEAAFSGPGTSGAGALTFSVGGGVPGGFGLLMVGPSSLVPGVEMPLFGIADAPLFAGLDLVTGYVLPFVLALDGAGDLALDLANPGGLEGNLAAQVLVLDEALLPVATSTVASF